MSPSAERIWPLCQEFLSDPEPACFSHITTDWDSAASRGVKVMGVHGKNVEALRDTRHLAQSQKRAIDTAKFSERMFPGRTVTYRHGTKRKFSKDLMERYSAEYDLAVKKHWPMHWVTPQISLWTVKHCETKPVLLWLRVILHLLIYIEFWKFQALLQFLNMFYI